MTIKQLRNLGMIDEYHYIIIRDVSGELLYSGTKSTNYELHEIKSMYFNKAMVIAEI